MIRAHKLQVIVDAGLAPSEHWLTVRLRRREIRGRKVGREWRMTDADVEALADYLANTPNVAEESGVVLRLTPAAARRRPA